MRDEWDARDRERAEDVARVIREQHAAKQAGRVW
jgi:hypothetical protein